MKPIKALGILFGHNKHEVRKLNWDDKIEKIEAMINGWKKRYFSLFGKITIIKSLGMSKIAYVASMIETPNLVVQRLNNVFMNFLWGGKRSKIRKEIIVQKFEKGGLQMINIDAFIKSLKCRWVNRLVNAGDETWKAIIEHHFREFGGCKLIFNYNLDKKGLVYITRNMPCFYREVIMNWYKVVRNNDNLNLTPSSIGEQIIWGNRHLNAGYKSVLFFKEWIESGIIHIADLFNNGSFIRYNTLLDKLKCKSNWIVQYIEVKKAIPKTWYRIMCEVSNKIYIRFGRIQLRKRAFNGEYKDMFDFACKDIYWNIVSNSSVKTYAPKIWKKDCGKDCNWKEIWVEKIKCMPVKKIAQFNYYLLYNKIPHKENLFKWKIMNNPFCEICKNIEDSKHFLYECKAVKQFWRKCNNIINQLYRMNVRLLWKHIVYGYRIYCKTFDVFNLILMVATFAVYKARILERRDIEQIIREEIFYINYNKKNKMLKEFANAL